MFKMAFVPARDKILTRKQLENRPKNPYYLGFSACFHLFPFVPNILNLSPYLFFLNKGYKGKRRMGKGSGNFVPVGDKRGQIWSIILTLYKGQS